MGKKEILFGLTAAIFLALILSPFASPWPDGLERVAGDKGFLKKGDVEPILTSPVPDYAWPGVSNEIAATSIAGLFGTLIVFGIVYGLAVLVRHRA